MTRLRDFMNKELLLKQYDHEWEILEISRKPYKLNHIILGWKCGIKTKDNTKLEDNHYLLDLELIIFRNEYEAELYGKVRKYYPKSDTERKTQKDVVITLIIPKEKEETQNLIDSINLK